jgi:hypothetical protein
LLAQGLKIPKFSAYVSFDLPVTIILATIGSTTATIIGIFIVVVNYLFPKGKSFEAQSANDDEKKK